MPWFSGCQNFVALELDILLLLLANTHQCIWKTTAFEKQFQQAALGDMSAESVVKWVDVASALESLRRRAQLWQASAAFQWPSHVAHQNLLGTSAAPVAPGSRHCAWFFLPWRVRLALGSPALRQPLEVPDDCAGRFAVSTDNGSCGGLQFARVAAAQEFLARPPINPIREATCHCATSAQSPPRREIARQEDCLFLGLTRLADWLLDQPMRESIGEWVPSDISYFASSRCFSFLASWPLSFIARRRYIHKRKSLQSGNFASLRRARLRVAPPPLRLCATSAQPALRLRSASHLCVGSAPAQLPLRSGDASVPLQFALAPIQVSASLRLFAPAL